MAPRIPPLLLLALVCAAPAAAQAPPGGGQLEIGDAVTIAGAPIKDGKRTLGEIVLTRVGDRVEATARFSRRPPGRKASLCLTVGGERHCVKRSSKPGLRLRLEDTAGVGVALRARARSNGARGSVEL